MKDRIAISKAFNLFEETYSDELKKLKLHETLAWAIVKTPLYFNLISEDIVRNISHNSFRNRAVELFKKLLLQFKKVTDTISLLFLLVRIKYRIFKKKNITLFYTSSTDKLTMDENGTYSNSLTDAFIASKLVTNYIYAEQPIDGNYKLPSLVGIDLKLDLLYPVASFYRLSLGRNAVIRSLAERLVGLLIPFLKEQEIWVEIKTGLIQKIIIDFFAEYKANKMLLDIIKPYFIITSERIGTGLIAAANKNCIKSVDLQHGIIDNFHPQYIYSSKLKDSKDAMLLSSFIGVFGELHKDMILENGFWDNSEVIVLGSSRFEMNRGRLKTLTFDLHNEKQILIPTQWTYFDETKLLIDKLLQIDIQGLKIILKIHPHEPQNNTDYYYSLSGKYEGKIRIAGRNEDVYKFIGSSFLVVGFDSAVLFESIGLSKPCVTIGTRYSPDGIHSLYNGDKMKSAIKTVRISDLDKIELIIEDIILGNASYNTWLDEIHKMSVYLYAENYLGNCKSFINSLYPGGYDYNN